MLRALSILVLFAASGFSFACGAVVVGFGYLAERIATHEAPSPIGRAPTRYTMAVASDGDCNAPCFDYRFSELGGTR